MTGAPHEVRAALPDPLPGVTARFFRVRGVRGTAAELAFCAVGAGMLRSGRRPIETSGGCGRSGGAEGRSPPKHGRSTSDDRERGQGRCSVRRSDYPEGGNAR